MSANSLTLIDGVLTWYAAHARELPWREPDCTPWGVLVSEVMLQQTPVARVEPVWRSWMQRWPQPADLAAEAPGEAIRAWGRLGYPRRALRLHECATALAQRHGGAVPSDHAVLLSLPGIGEYTAAAVASFAFGQRHAVIDTNVRRVLARALSGQAQAATALTAAERALAHSILPAEASRAATWGVASMELGALICTARAPRCDSCPVRSQCAWIQAGSPEASGPPRRGQAWQGTDRQLRGQILALLRDSAHPLSGQELAQGVAEGWDKAQRDRCLHTLITDGLVSVEADGRFALP